MIYSEDSTGMLDLIISSNKDKVIT